MPSPSSSPPRGDPGSSPSRAIDADVTSATSGCGRGHADPRAVAELGHRGDLADQVVERRSARLRVRGARARPPRGRRSPPPAPDAASVLAISPPPSSSTTVRSPGPGASGAAQHDRAGQIGDERRRRRRRELGGAARWTTRPRSSTTTRSASSAASAKSWVTITAGTAARAAGPRARRTRRARVRDVERRERLVEEQQPRLARRARGRGRPAGARRRRARPAGVGAVARARTAPASRSARCRRSARAPRADPVGDVAPGGHRREERVLLEDEADPAPLGRDGPIPDSGSSHASPPSVTRPRSGALRPGDQPQQRALARTGGPDERDALSRATSSSTSRSRSPRRSASSAAQHRHPPAVRRAA